MIIGTVLQYVMLRNHLYQLAMVVIESVGYNDVNVDSIITILLMRQKKCSVILTFTVTEY
jgi:hypothetical protein